MKLPSFIFLIIFLPIIARAQAQNQPRYWYDVQIIKSYDRLFQPPLHPIVFVGSSSIRKWDDLQMAFGKYGVLNRGIGGAVINDIIFYLNDLVFAYQPRQIVLYVGENDLIDKTETADTVLNRTVRLYQNIRNRLPDVPIIYIALKPSPSRDEFTPKAMEANLLIKKFLSTQKNTVFVDVFKLMISPEGKSRPELFVSDMLHMNAQGYAIWEKAIKPYLPPYKNRP